jgi:anti-sigma factor RsiW
VLETPISEQKIISYLLGELSEEEQVEIEDRAFSDQKVVQEILAVEQDLVDDYVSGDIPEERRRKFETHFLASAERRKKVAFAKALATVVNESPVSQEQPAIVTVAPAYSWRTRLTAFFARPVTAYSFAAASLVLFVVGSWLVFDRIRLRSELTQLRSNQDSQLAQRQRLEKDLANERLKNEELVANRGTPSPQTPTPDTLPQTPSQPPKAASPIIATLALLPGISRGSTSVPQVSIAKDASLLRLQIGVDPQENYSRYRVELRNEKGQQVLAQGNLAARARRNGRNITLSVPAKVINNGRYEVALKGIAESGKSEDVGFYYFDVVKQ